MLLIGIASQYYNDKIKDRVIDESQDAVEELQISSEMEAYLYRSFINAQYYLDEPYRATLEPGLQDSLTSIENIKRKVRIALQGLNNNLKRIERLLKNDGTANFTSPEARRRSMETVAQLKNGIRYYNSLMEQLLSYDQGEFQDAKALLTVTLEPYYRTKLLPLVERFRSQIRTNLDDQVVVLENRLTRYSNILLAATLVAFIISLILAYLLYRSITKPIYSLALAADEIGRGNLEKRIEVQSDDEIGHLARSFNRMAENLDKITFSKEYVDDILESMGDALIVTDREGNITKVNSETLNMLGYIPYELIEQPVETIFGHREGVRKEGIIDNIETHLKRKDGGLIPVNLSKSMIEDKEGVIQSRVYVASDITELKKSEKMIKESLEEKEILLAEIHHRVKNNLAVISGLLQMQRWETENEAAQEVLQDSQLRVKSIALVHEKLYQSVNLSSISFDHYVGELVEGINQTFNSSKTDIDFDIEVEPIVFSVSQAIPCSLLLNELVVNVHKHAFGDRKKGEVMIRLWRDERDVHLVVKDNGQGMQTMSDLSDQSLGMSLVNTLVEQLNGQIEIKNEEGTTFNITFELDES